MKSNSGFSLIEMVISLLIIGFMMLALSAAMVNSITVNRGNGLRNTSVGLSSRTAAVLLAEPFDTVLSCGITADPEAAGYMAQYSYDGNNPCLGPYGNDYQRYPDPVQMVRGFQKRFNIIWDEKLLSEDLRQITVKVCYRHHDKNYTNTTVIYKHKKQ